MRRFCVIPSRFGSSRLPGKPLKEIQGKPMVMHVVDRAKEAGFSSVIVATDDSRIADAVEDCGVKCVMTSPDHQSGTDRIYEVISKIAADPEDIVVNVQGDEPLMPPSCITQVCELLERSPLAGMATLAAPIKSASEIEDKNIVKVVTNRYGEAMYFSRAPIPYDRDTEFRRDEYEMWMRHIGIYAYRASFIRKFVEFGECEVERVEKLEQLRALFMGGVIAVEKACEVPPHGVDTEADLASVRKCMESA